MENKQVCLIIRDGWGRGESVASNAIFTANTPYADKYERENPTVLIATSGISVGLPQGYQGNSEVGHLNIGAGRVVYQSLTRIDNDISSGEFYKIKAFHQAIDISRIKNSQVHLLGLIQEEGVHAVTRHCSAILEICRARGVKEVLIHAISDGRDTPPKSAVEHFNYLSSEIQRIGIGRIATVQGRYYAMDRDKRWDRTEIAYNAIISAIGKPVKDWQAAIKDAYDHAESDEFIKPRIIDYHGVGRDDVFIFFNFRFDRTRQLTQAIVERGFQEFNTIDHKIHFVTMTHYYDNGNFREAFPEVRYDNILGEVLARNKIRQLRISETEKYAHVTFFFNALRNDPFDLEERVMVNSPRVATYDLKPEMSAFEIKDKIIEAVESEQFGVIICNFANCDMVGHTGKFNKILKAVETVDICTGQVVEAVRKKGGVCIITADHGNAEETELEDGSPKTAHTTNPVPLSIIGAGNIKLRKGGKLSDIAPTILDLLNLAKPVEMTGKSLIWIKNGNKIN